MEKTLGDHFKKGERVLPLASIANFLYGGNTSTFKKHNRANLRQMEEYKRGEDLTLSARMSSNKSPTLRKKKCFFDKFKANYSSVPPN